MNKLDEALKNICLALRQVPNDLSLLDNFASILVMLGNKDHAKEVYKKLLSIKPREIWKKKLLNL